MEINGYEYKVITYSQECASKEFPGSQHMTLQHAASCLNVCIDENTGRFNATKLSNLFDFFGLSGLTAWFQFRCTDVGCGPRKLTDSISPMLEKIPVQWVTIYLASDTDKTAVMYKALTYVAAKAIFNY